MKSLLVLTLSALATLSISAPTGAPERTWTFDDSSALELWSIRQTRPTTALATWEVVEDASAPSPPGVLALSETRNDDATFNLAIATDTSLRDVDITVHVKAVSGRIDQGGGPIWRCRDENNYYVSRFNPLESNFRLYLVKDGRRRQLDSARVETRPGKWYTLRMTMEGEHMRGFLDGKQFLDATDSTFREAGMVGLWTKSDAATRFDDLHVKSLAPEGTARLESKGLIDLGAASGRIDHMSLDPGANLLYVAAFGKGMLEVIDLDSMQITGTIRGLDQPQGVQCLPRRNLVLVTCGGDGTLRAIDCDTLEESFRVDLGDDADTLRIDEARGLAWVGCGAGRLASVNLETMAAAAAIPLAAHP